MEYYTIDFETANANMTSPCSIGIVGVDNGKIVMRKHILINPEEPFLPFNITIHSITPLDVVHAKNFCGVWEEIKSYFQSQIVFSHCSGFDFHVLDQTMTKYQIAKPIFRFGDTLRIARLLWDKETMPNHKLNTIAMYLEHEFNHHNALSDAEVCVHIIERAKKILQVDDVKEVYDALELRFGYFGPDRFYDTYQLKRRYRKDRPKEPHPFLYDKLFIYSGKPSHVTKKEWIDNLLQCGAYVDTIVSKKADYVVLLNNYKPEKKRKAERLIQEGVPLCIIDEEDVERMKAYDISYSISSSSSKCS
ncbi:MAG: exonuclease domain-containing protein [Bacilli bacterium]